MKNKFKVGDIISNGIITRKIEKVMSIGYLWSYPEVPNKLFNSNNSNDPSLEIGWTKL